MIGVAAGMEDLQRYLAPLLMHRTGHLLVLGHLPGKAQLGTVGHQPATQVGGDAAGHDEADPAPGPLAIEGGQLVKAPLLLFEAGVHGAHQHAVAQLGKTQIEGGQQGRVTAHHELLVGAGLDGTTPIPRRPDSGLEQGGSMGGRLTGPPVNFLLSNRG